MAATQAERPGGAGNGRSPESGAVIWLRHDAGLTSGRSMPLGPGSYCFGPSAKHHGGLGDGHPDVVSFKLEVAADGSVVVAPGTEPLAIEGSPVEKPTKLEDGQAIQLVTDHFFIDRPADSDGDGAKTANSSTSPDTEPVRLGSLDPGFARRLFGSLTALGALGALIDLRFLVLSALALSAWLITTVARRRYVHDHEGGISSLAQHRHRATLAARGAVPTPSTVDVVANGGATWPFDGKVSLASGDQAWTPSSRASGASAGSFLPAVPLAVDLRTQSVAIVGPRAAQLAVSRHLVSAVIALDPDTTVAVASARRDDWAWIPPTTSRRELTVVDLDGSATSARRDIRPGSIVVSESAEKLPAVDVVLTLDDDGTASARLADGSTATGLVPHGITPSQARRITDATKRRTLITLGSSSDPTGVGPSGSTTNEQPSDAVGVIDLRFDDLPRIGVDVFDNHRIMVTGQRSTSDVEALASAAIVHVHRRPDPALFVIDKGDRALIRLTQLPRCRRYTSIDDIDSVSSIVNDLEILAAATQGDERPALLLFRGVLEGLDFLERAGFGSLSARIHELLKRSMPIDVAASLSSTVVGSPPAPESSAPAGLAEHFLVWIHHPGDFSTTPLIVADDNGRHVLHSNDVPGRDLTQAVARSRQRGHTSGASQ